MIFFDVIPVSKPRMTQSDKWNERKCVMKYGAYKDELNYKANSKQFKLGTVIDLIFILPYKKNWDEKMQQDMDGLCHQGKPDIDNLIKGFLDALTVDDSKIWHISGKKYWGRKGAVIVLRNDTKLSRYSLDEYTYYRYLRDASKTT